MWKKKNALRAKKVKRSKIKKTVKPLSKRFERARNVTKFSTVSTFVVFSPLLLVEPTGVLLTSIALTSGIMGGAAGGVTAAADGVKGLGVVEWTTLSGQRIRGAEYLKARIEELQMAILELHDLNETATDKERVKIARILQDYAKYTKEISKKVTILDAGNLGGSKTEVTFLTRRSFDAKGPKFKIEP